MMHNLWPLIKETVNEWLEDKAARLGAALAFYGVLSIGPLLILTISIAGLVFGYDVVSRHLLDQIRSMIGDQGATAIEAVLRNSQNSEDNIYVTLIGAVTLLVGATGFFGQMQDAMNTIWKVQPPKNRPIWHIIRSRFLSFVMVLGTGFLLLISLVINAALDAFAELMSGALPDLVMHILNFLADCVVETLLFAMIFKVLPDSKIRWSDVWDGAILTTLLFIIGKYVIAFYLGHSAIGSVYGAAGSVIVILVWVYYSAQILFLGAEFTQVYAKWRGSGIVPARGARLSPSKQG